MSKCERTNRVLLRTSFVWLKPLNLITLDRRLEEAVNRTRAQLPVMMGRMLSVCLAGVIETRCRTAVCIAFIRLLTNTSGRTKIYAIILKLCLRVIKCGRDYSSHIIVHGF